MTHDLVGSFEDLVHAEIPKEPFDWVVLKVAIAAMHLQAVVDDVEAFICRELFGHGTVHCVVRVAIIDAFGAVSYHKTRCL